MSGKKEEQGVYRQLSADMREGLKDIYRQISTVSSETGLHQENQTATDVLFTEAGDQLDEVVKATESAAMSIMEIVEKQLANQEERAKILERGRGGGLSPQDVERLFELNNGLGNDLTAVLTTLSFQDITGQRIKKVVAALNAIEESVVQLYVSSGLIMDGAEKDPAKDSGALQAEAKKAVEDFRETRKGGSQLKGPDRNGISQGAIDDILAQLGL